MDLAAKIDKDGPDRPTDMQVACSNHCSSTHGVALQAVSLLCSRVSEKPDIKGSALRSDQMSCSC